MKAVRVHQHGDVAVLRYEDAPTPQAARGEVVIRVHACALNHLDLWVRRGLPGVELPHIAGSDVAGEVVELGEGVTGVQVGERVTVNPGLSCGHCEWCLAGEQNICDDFRILGYLAPGGYAEYCKVPVENVYPIPNDFPYEAAAAFPLVTLTAWHMLITRAKLKPGETVLVLAAGSGIGSVAIQIGKHAGARVIATASTNEKLAQAIRLGADHVINYIEHDFAKEALRLTAGRGVDVVFEHVGVDTFERSLRALGRNGRLVTCGATTGPKPQIDLRFIYAKQLQIIGSIMGTQSDFRALLPLVFAGKIKPVIDRVYPLAEAAAAHRQLESRNVFGKIILQP